MLVLIQAERFAKHGDHFFFFSGADDWYIRVCFLDFTVILLQIPTVGSGGVFCFGAITARDWLLVFVPAARSGCETNDIYFWERL